MENHNSKIKEAEKAVSRRQTNGYIIILEENLMQIATRKFLSVLLATVILVSMLPVSAAQAAENEYAHIDSYDFIEWMVDGEVQTPQTSVTSPDSFDYTQWIHDNISTTSPSAIQFDISPSSTEIIIEVSDATELRNALTSGAAGRTIRLLNSIHLGAWNSPNISGDIANFILDGSGYILTHASFPGLLGDVNGGNITIKNLGVSCNINVNYSGATQLSGGGFIGYVNASDIIFEKSFVTGQSNIFVGRYRDTNLSGNVHAGGFIGTANNSYILIKDCFSNARVQAFIESQGLGGVSLASYAGGFIGRNTGNLNIINSYTFGEIISHTWANNPNSTLLRYAGGLVGNTSANNIMGSVSGAGAARFSGSGGWNYPGISGIQLSNLRDNWQFPLSSWDFTNTWTYRGNENNGLPVLRVNVTGVVLHDINGNPIPNDEIPMRTGDALLQLELQFCQEMLIPELSNGVAVIVVL